MSLKIACEINLETVPCVLAWDAKLFVGTEDGSIKTFDADLKPVKSWAAHAVQPFAIAASGGKVYSSSNDGGVRVWTSEGEKVLELPHGGENASDVISLTASGPNIFTGDEAGNVTIYENNTLKALYNVLEEVKGLQYRQPFLYTVRDLYVTITEIKPEDSKTRFVTRHTVEGRAPIALNGEWLIVVARDGFSLKLHHANVENEFKLSHELKVSDMIVTSIAADGDFVWTAGWDGHVKRWQIVNGQLQAAGDINLGSCVNALTANSSVVYAAVTGGRLVGIKAA